MLPARPRSSRYGSNSMSSPRNSFNREGMPRPSPLPLKRSRRAKPAFGPDSAWVAADLNNLAQIYDQQGKYAEAEPLFQRALQVQEKIAGPDDRTVATFLSNQS